MVLKCRYQKWNYILHLQFWNYEPKKNWKSNWQFDFQSLKLRKQKSHDFQIDHMIWCWKGLFEGYNFPFERPSIKKFIHELWVHKIIGFIN
jgi:hypothetical protein